MQAGADVVCYRDPVMHTGEPLLAVELDHLVATLRSSPYLLEIRGAPRHYAWGGHDVIPGLLGVENPGRTPFAELWFGSHPSAPALVRVGREWLPIVDVVRLAGDGLTGPAAAGRFGPGLPYLLKVLDVRSMLSIQAHPSREQAEEGFAREDGAGIDRGAAGSATTATPATSRRSASPLPISGC